MILKPLAYWKTSEVRVPKTSFSMNDDEMVTEPMVNSNKFSQIVQEVTTRHMSRTVLDGSASSIVKGNPSPMEEIQTSKIHRVPWMNELLARKEKVLAKGDDFMKIAEQNDRRYSFKFHRNEVTPEATKIQSFDELKTAEQSKSKEENVTITTEHDIKKPLKKVMAPPIPVDLPPKLDKKQLELVPKVSIKSVLNEVESFLERGKQFEENTLMKIRELENSIRKQMDEEAKWIELLKRDLTRLMENSS
ncbi:uncharacterized protein LOC116166045 isoform X2 [Photinus pyralis]|uniref:uncharacterized protein LOC116166045 isoform X2 n=1 Tax=Photinus pyralis TaxID=7054 RepID=UPI00126717A8|nr:uncharacterized protein LOC116166045 isoform X2 [Photinus pyralis]